MGYTYIDLSNPNLFRAIPVANIFKAPVGDKVGRI